MNAKTALRLIRLIPGVSKKLGGKLGKRFDLWLGIVTTTAGIGMCFIPGAQGWAAETIVSGVLITAGGAGRKTLDDKKQKQKEKEKSDG